jgi:hypothetical protein
MTRHEKPSPECARYPRFSCTLQATILQPRRQELLSPSPDLPQTDILFLLVCFHLFRT